METCLEELLYRVHGVGMGIRGRGRVFAGDERV